MPICAAALTEPGHLGRTYPITGPAAITHVEIADAIGAAVGRDVSFVDAPPDVFAAALRGALPEWQVEGLLEDYAHYARGEASAVSPVVSEGTGADPRDVATFAKDYASAFAAGDLRRCFRRPFAGTSASRLPATTPTNVAKTPRRCHRQQPPVGRIFSVVIR